MATAITTHFEFCPKDASMLLTIIRNHLRGTKQQITGTNKRGKNVRARGKTEGKQAAQRKCFMDAITHASHTKLKVIHYVHIVLIHTESERKRNSQTLLLYTHNNKKINILVVHYTASLRCISHFS